MKVNAVCCKVKNKETTFDIYHVMANEGIYRPVHADCLLITVDNTPHVATLFFSKALGIVEVVTPKTWTASRFVRMEDATLCMQVKEI